MPYALAMRTLTITALIISSLTAHTQGEHELEATLREGVSRYGLPGASCVIQGPRGRIERATVHHPSNAIFDCASLTKVVCTTTAVMQLVESGRLNLDDKAADHLRGFGTNGKEEITIEQLLRHRGGLLPDNALRDYLNGAAEARRRIYALDLRAPPGSRTIYTDVGFIVLGWIVEELTGAPLDAYARDRIFEPCGMTDTRFVRTDAAPELPWRDRCVPTEPARAGEAPLKGIVHDPRARALGGVAGHAGMFSTAEDLRRFLRMLADGGMSETGERVLKRETVAAMTRLPGSRDTRGLGWRVGSAGVIWHTGFTGTAVWLGPSGRSAVLLASRLAGEAGAEGGPLRDEIAVAAGCSPDGVLTGVDVVERRGWPRNLRGLKVGLITNHTGRTREGRSTIDILNESRRVHLKTLFSPEHGIRGVLDSKVEDEVDEKTGLKVHSLYGESRRPSAAALRGLDALVFDIQDIGTRFYTYVSTMVNCMEEAANQGTRFIVLDRPNPIAGVLVEGPIADADALDFVGRLPIPIRHGMTVGELAGLARSELGLRLDLQVIRCEGWSRERHLDTCGLPWINPSPNMRSLDEALLYPGIGVLETTNLSVGRGTATPFEHVGAPWMDGEAVARALQGARIPGVEIAPTWFTPDASKFKDQRCSGVRFTITDRETLRPVRLGLTLASVLVHHHGEAWDTRKLPRLLKHHETLDGVLARRPFAILERRWQPDLRRFLEQRDAHLLYKRTRGP